MIAIACDHAGIDLKPHVIAVLDELGIPYTLKDVDPPAPERVEHATKILRGEFQQA